MKRQRKKCFFSNYLQNKKYIINRKKIKIYNGSFELVSWQRQHVLNSLMIVLSIALNADLWTVQVSSQSFILNFIFIFRRGGDKITSLFDWKTTCCQKKTFWNAIKRYITRMVKNFLKFFLKKSFLWRNDRNSSEKPTVWADWQNEFDENFIFFSLSLSSLSEGEWERGQKSIKTKSQ